MLTDQGKDIRIIKLPETEEIKPGYSVPVDDEVDGTKKFDLSRLTTAIEGKADASEIEALQEEIASKVGPEEIEELETQIAGKADAADVYTKDEVDGLLEDKVDADEVYGKDEIDSMIEGKADYSDLEVLSAALEEKADSADVYTIDEINDLLDEKADTDSLDQVSAYVDSSLDNIQDKFDSVEDILDTVADDISTVSAEIEGRATLEDLVTLSATVDQLEDAVSETREDITALQTAVEDIPIIPDTSAASAGNFLSFDGTSMEWTEIPDMKVLAGTDIKVEENVVSVNTNGTTRGEYSFVEGFNTYAGGPFDHVEGVGGVSDVAGTNHVEGFQYHLYTANFLASSFHGSSIVKFQNQPLINRRGWSLGFGDLYEFVKLFKDRFIVSCDYSTSTEAHFTENSFFMPSIYNITDISLDDTDIVLTLDRELVCPSSSGTIKLYGPITIMRIMGGGGSLQSGEVLNTFRLYSLGFSGNNTETVRPDNAFIGISLNYTKEGDTDTTTESKILKILSIEYSDPQYIITTEDVIVPEITGGSYNLTIYVINPIIYGCNHIEGQDNFVYGTSNSHAEGFYNTINRDCSHAEGSHNLSDGQYSHVEGFYTSACENCTHAEGSYTLAQSEYSHAEGYKTSVIDVLGEDNGGSHAEGYQTSACVIGSHSEGYNTYAKGTGAHSEGYKTVANASRAHAEGNNSRATGSNSHAEGYYTIARGDNSHSEGNYTSAYSDQTHAEGLRTYAGATAAHSEGWDTSAMSPGTHAEGRSTYVYGLNAHAEGQRTRAEGQYSHVEGCETSAFGSGGHAEGYQTYSNYEYSHAEGYETSASSNYTHSEGKSTLASGISSHAEGYNNKSTGDYSHTEGNDTSATSNAAHAEGSGTIAAGPFSHAEGLNTHAKGTASHATGMGTEANAYAFACGKYNVDDGNSLFTVGNGEDDSNRNTCFKVDKNGGVWFMYNGLLTNLATLLSNNAHI